MGAASTNLPTLVVTAGARPPARLRGRRLGTGTDLWRLWDERRSRRLDDATWREAEQALSCGQGACNTMGTASTMGILAEVLGFALPGSSTIPTGDERALAAAEAAGERIVQLVRADAAPRRCAGRLAAQRPARAQRHRRLHQRGDPPRRRRRPARPGLGG